MKTVLNIVLAACAAALVYVCYGSIMGPINFDNTKKARETEVIARLIDIRKAQVEYRNTHEGKYTASFDTLIDFVKTAIYIIRRHELTTGFIPLFVSVLSIF